MTYSLVEHSLLSAFGSDSSIIISELHYWLSQTKYEVGIVSDGMRYIYNSLDEWQKKFNWLSRSKIYRIFKELRDKGVVSFKQLEKHKYNRTGYYSLNYEKLQELSIDLLKPSKTSTFHQRNIDISPVKRLYIDTDNTYKKTQAKHDCLLDRDRNTVSELVDKDVVNQPESQIEILAPHPSINPSPVKKKEFARKQKSRRHVEQKINNSEWRSHLEKLDEIGVKLNQNLERLVKEHATGDVEAAIAICVERKRKGTIVNLEGYFVQALKEGWGKQQVLSANTANTASVFACWYGLMREMGDVCGQEIRDGEIWVNANGYWERFEDMWERGVTLDYVRKRYQNVQRR